MNLPEFEHHYPEEWTDTRGIRRMTCVCGKALPCPKEGKCNHINPNNRMLICNRERGHPGEHCRDQFKTGGTAYENIWWTNARLDRTAASAGTVGGVVGLLPVGLIPIPPIILQEANRRAMENGDLTFGHGIALVLALCATWGLCAVAVWIKLVIVRRSAAKPGDGMEAHL